MCAGVCVCVCSCIWRNVLICLLWHVDGTQIQIVLDSVAKDNDDKHDTQE